MVDVPKRSGAEGSRPADARRRVADFAWSTVPDPPAGSGAMTDETGRSMSEAEVDEWFAARLAARRHA